MYIFIRSDHMKNTTKRIVGKVSEFRRKSVGDEWKWATGW